jgi:DNA-binding NarL/FixJ family response regulator
MSAACQQDSVDAAIVDVSYPKNQAIETVARLMERQMLKGAVFLDDRLAVVRGGKALGVANSIYAVRAIDLDVLCVQIRQLAAAGAAAAARPPGPRSPHFFRRVDELARFDVHGFLGLSPRELAVIEQFARGQTGKQVARRLGLAVSTVDNHKTRLMKKLGVHTQSQLTRLAIAAGVVD